MKRLFIAMALTCAAFIGANAQEVYQAALNMARETAEDETKPIDLRKIATFKYDELCYTAQRTLEQMPDKKAELDDQALALYEFLDLFLSNYEQEESAEENHAGLQAVLHRQSSL